MGLFIQQCFLKTENLLFVLDVRLYDSNSIFGGVKRLEKKPYISCQQHNGNCNGFMVIKGIVLVLMETTMVW